MSTQNADITTSHLIIQWQPIAHQRITQHISWGKTAQRNALKQEHLSHKIRTTEQKGSIKIHGDGLSHRSIVFSNSLNLAYNQSFSVSPEEVACRTNGSWALSIHYLPLLEGYSVGYWQIDTSDPWCAHSLHLPTDLAGRNHGHISNKTSSFGGRDVTGNNNSKNLLVATHGWASVVTYAHNKPQVTK